MEGFIPYIELKRIVNDTKEHKTYNPQMTEGKPYKNKEIKKMKE